MYDGRRQQRLQANERIIIHLAQSERTTRRHQRTLCVNNATRYGNAIASCWWHWPLHMVTSLPIGGHVTAARGQAMVKRRTLQPAFDWPLACDVTLHASIVRAAPRLIHFRSQGTSNGLPVQPQRRCQHSACHRAFDLLANNFCGYYALKLSLMSKLRAYLAQ